MCCSVKKYHEDVAAGADPGGNWFTRGFIVGMMTDRKGGNTAGGSGGGGGAGGDGGYSSGGCGGGGCGGGGGAC